MDGDFTRRSFVVGGLAVMAAAVAPVVLAQPAMAAVATAVAGPATTLRRSRFTPLVGETFKMTDGRRSISVVLSEIADLKPTVKAGDELRFSLLFTGSDAAKLPQGTYRLVNARLGSVPLLVVPVGRSVKARVYEAIINAR